MIKLFFTNLLKSKAGSFVSTIFTTWRAYVLLAVIFGVYILSLNAQIKTAEFKRDRAYKKTAKIQLKLDTRNIELETCQAINTSNDLELSKVIVTANQCANQWKQVKDDNALVIKQIKDNETQHAKEIERIKNIKPVSTCDSELLNDIDTNWLLGKKTDS